MKIIYAILFLIITSQAFSQQGLIIVMERYDYRSLQEYNVNDVFYQDHVDYYYLTKNSKLEIDRVIIKVMDITRKLTAVFPNRCNPESTGFFSTVTGLYPSMWQISIYSKDTKLAESIIFEIKEKQK